MSDRIAIYRAGRIEQIGTGEDLYERPASLFVADFVGESTVFRGTLEWRTALPRLVGGVFAVPVSVDGCRRASLGDGDRAAVVVRPEWLTVEPESAAATSSPRAAVGGGTLTEEIYLGSTRKYVVDLPAGVRATARVSGSISRVRELVPGTSVRVCWEVEHGVVVADDARLVGTGAAEPAAAGIEAEHAAQIEQTAAVTAG
jgi:putative spermidine/putrescine transport system ATP-binding protein